MKVLLRTADRDLVNINLITRDGRIASKLSQCAKIMAKLVDIFWSTKRQLLFKTSWEFYHYTVCSFSVINSGIVIKSTKEKNLRISRGEQCRF